MKKQENGKEMQIVYLRMMLSSIDKGGYIYYQGVYDTLEEELAEEFDEDVEIVRSTLAFLQKNNMISINENSDCFIPEVVKSTGSECSSAERVRRHRQNAKTLQCNTSVTKCDSDVTRSNVETETEQEKETEKENRTETEQRCVSAVASVLSNPLFSEKELLDIAFENKINISVTGIKKFYAEMQTTGWILYGKPVEKESIVRVLRAYLKYNTQYYGEVAKVNKFVGELETEEDEELVGDDWWKI